MLSNFSKFNRFKANNLGLKVSNFRYKALRLKLKDSQGNRLLV
jgi:hypothetical protein